MIQRYACCLSVGLLLTSPAAAKEPPPVEPGHPAPGFAIEDAEGRVVRLADYRGRSHVILVFGRAHW
ncbi:MAG: redoxin domain-containing protein [Phycisphaerae bacterium]|nr:redoxin domain-containing protein [Phycisphaerae bacterium]